MTSLTTWGHAAVSLEKNGRRVTIDPGIFSLPDPLQNSDAVLLTHAHPDHLDVDGLRVSESPIWGDHEVVSTLEAHGFPPARLNTIAPGDAFAVAGFDVEAFGGTHAVIHPDLPDESNVGYLIDGKYLHPGDSFSTPTSGARAEVLFLPVSAPWLNFTQAIDFVREVSPAVVIAIHDASLSEPGKALTDRVLSELLGTVRYLRLAEGETVTLSDS